MPSTSYVGLECVVGRDVSKQPPWSMETSTSTAWRFISFSWARVTTCGARAPATSTAPMTRSASARCSSIASVDAKQVSARPPKATSSSRRRSMLRSKTVTSASMPMAMNAAFIPTTPPPMTITFAAATPGTPPSSTPRPPSGFSTTNAPARAPAQTPPAPAERLLEHERARLVGDLAGHLAHRREQRQAPVRVLDRLVGDADGARLAQASREVGSGREVEVCEERVLGAQQVNLLRLRLLHAEDQLGLAEDRLRVGQDARALGLVV